MDRFLKFLVIPAVVFICSACASPTTGQKRFFWPPGADQAKIEFIDFYLADQDLRRGKENRFLEAIFGREIPEAIFSRPHAISSDGKGRVFVSDLAHRKVFVLDLVAGRLRTLKNETGGDFAFGLPMGIAVDLMGRVYVCDSGTGRIFVFGADEKPIVNFGQGQLTRPTSIAVDSRGEKIYVVDTGAHRVAVFDLNGSLQTYLGGRGTGPGEFNYPLDVAVDRVGNLYILDAMNARVQVLDLGGKFLRQFGERGTAPGSFQMAKSIAVSPSGHVYVTDGQAHHFVIFDAEGRYLLTVGGRYLVRDGQVSPGGFYLPQGIDVDDGEAIWVVDSLNQSVYRFQYLNSSYLEKNPILPQDVYLPPGI